MPILLVDTNVDLDKAKAVDAAKEFSARAAELLGKPEGFVQAMVNPGKALVMGGSEDPVVYAVLQSIGLPDSECSRLSAGLCKTFEDVLGVPPARTYIIFEDLTRARTGWDSKTFAG